MSFARLEDFYRTKSSTVADTPNGAVSVFADEKAAVLGDGDSHRATPHLAFGCNEAGHEIFVFTARFAGGMIDGYAHDLITSAFHSVPRSVEGCENVVLVFRRKLVAGVETQIKRGRVRLHEDIRHDDFISELKMFSLMPRIRMVANVKPRPAIKAAGTHSANVVGR